MKKRSADALSQYLYLMDEAFDQGRWHSLVGNLSEVRDEDWEWTPPGGSRSIRAIVEHVGECKIMYEDHAFGRAERQWGELTPDLTATRDRAIEWLRVLQARLRGSVAALGDDAELLRPRRTNWGDMEPTRWIVGVMIEHDHYHAGEINHIRSLRSGDDRWAHERELDAPASA